MDSRKFFPTKYLSAGDLQKNMNKSKINVISTAVMRDRDGTPRDRIVFLLDGQTKTYVCGKTTYLTLKKRFGPETDNWLGKPILITKELKKLFGEMMDVIVILVDEEELRIRKDAKAFL